MMRLPILFLCCLLLLVAGCKQNGAQPGQGTPGQSYVPPEDRKITDPQAVKYIEAAKQSQLAIIKYQGKRKEFEAKYKLSPDQTELQDTLYLSKHPEVKTEAETLQKWFDAMMDSVYVKAGISDEEFTWVGGALGDTVNREIQKKVEADLNAFNKELEKKP